MTHPRHWPLVCKQVFRRRTRTVLTASGVAIAMFLFVAVRTLQQSVAAATNVTAADQTLVVYRANRFCPATSRLPQHYQSRIARIDGVESVIPVKVLVNNCAASLDVITFRGVPQENIPQLAAHWQWRGGTLDDWTRRTDAAIVGERLALRRGLRVGDSLTASGITVAISGIIHSTQPQDQDVAYVQLDLLQRSGGNVTLGVVTQFNVKVQGPHLLGSVASAIDNEFRMELEPTQTRPERAFIAQAGSDIIEIVRFTQVLGWACLAAVLGLIANSIVLSVQERIHEHAVFQTLGFRHGLIARLVISEGALMGMIGGVLAAAAAMVLFRFGNFSLFSEGLSISITLKPEMIAWGLAVSVSVGILAGLVPAFQASRRDVAQCFRTV